MLLSLSGTSVTPSPNSSSVTSWPPAALGASAGEGEEAAAGGVAEYAICGGLPGDPSFARPGVFLSGDPPLASMVTGTLYSPEAEAGGLADAVPC
mmetsp:Transcript_59851/g.175608  ORF Transcript_59851/g.175608 Transcript_59851/m.175608 type:complete len:95 (+) Transcript_59851:351-635(+)